MAKNEKNTDEKKALPSIQIKKPEITKASVSEFFRKYIRVLKLARRPTKEEFCKISAVRCSRNRTYRRSRLPDISDI